MADRSPEECRRIVALAIAAGDSVPSATARFADDPTAGFADLGFDSLAFMEFCIAIQSETGVELSVGAVEAMGSPEAVARHLGGLK